MHVKACRGSLKVISDNENNFAAELYTLKCKHITISHIYLSIFLKMSSNAQSLEMEQFFCSPLSDDLCCDHWALSLMRCLAWTWKHYRKHYSFVVCVISFQPSQSNMCLPISCIVSCHVLRSSVPQMWAAARYRDERSQKPRRSTSVETSSFLCADLFWYTPLYIHYVILSTV